MRRLGEVVVLMGVRCSRTVPMDMDVPRQHGSVAAKRRIEPIVRRLPLVAVPVGGTMVVIVPMIMLGELCLVGMRVAAMLDGDHSVEAVRLRDLFDGFPEDPMVREQEDLARSIGTERFDLDRVRVRSGQTKARRDAGFVDRKLKLTMIGWDPLQFRAVDSATAKVREVMSMAVPVPMAVSEAATSAQLAPSRDRDPTAEGNQGDARRSIDDVAEAGRNRDAGKPDH